MKWRRTVRSLFHHSIDQISSRETSPFLFERLFLSNWRRNSPTLNTHSTISVSIRRESQYLLVKKIFHSIRWSRTFPRENPSELNKCLVQSSNDMNDSFARIAHLEENSPCQTSGYNQQREELPMFMSIHIDMIFWSIWMSLKKKEREEDFLALSYVCVCSLLLQWLELRRLDFKDLKRFANERRFVL